MSYCRRQSIFRAASLLALTLFLCVQALAQQDQPLTAINYRLAMSRPSTHLFEVSIEVRMAPNSPNSFLDFQMPRWSPGRYAVFDFAKNVQEFRAGGVSNCPAGADCKPGAPLPVMRVDDQTWRVQTEGLQGFVVNYKVFGNDLSGTFSQLDDRHASFNGGSIFMYIVGHKPDPVKLTIVPPSGWRVVNGRTERPDQHEWQFPNYDIMIDNPTEIGPDWTVDDFKVDGKTYHVMVHSFGDEGGRRPALVREIEKIVRAETAMWGPPEFDAYTFLIHFAADGHSGDGMEHLTSTQIVEPGTLADPEMFQDTLDTVAHEFFHVWNVKRLRPLGLGPWDFTRPANTRGLWIAEGFTNYYGHLMLRRSGLWSEQKFFDTLGSYIKRIEGAPGSRLLSVEELSAIAPFIDGARHAQHTNLPNTTVSYYWKGEMTALVLDLLIRGRTHGKSSLDDVMRHAYEAFYLNSPKATYYLRGRGYTDEEFQHVAEETTGLDLGDFFGQYVRGVMPLPFDEALSYVGLRRVRKPGSERYTAGLWVDQDEEQAARISNVISGSISEDAGLSQGDVILSIGETKATANNWMTLLNHYKRNERVPLSIKRNNRTIQTTLTLRDPEFFEYHLEEIRDASPEARALRAAWLK